jgi:hypothetical protein
MTDAIFEQLDFEVEEAQEDPTVLRMSLASKDILKTVGHFLGAEQAGQTPKAVTMIFIPNLPSRPTELSYHSLMKCFCIWQPQK